MRAPRHSLLPSLALIFLALAALWAFTAPFLSGDVGWQIRAGQRLLDHGDVPRLNFLMFTAPLHPWVAQEWLSGVVFAWVDGLWGPAGLIVLRAVLFCGVLAGAYGLCRRLGAEPAALALVMVPVGAQLALHTALRPWLFSNLGILAALAICLRAQGDRRFYYALVPLFGLWGLLHGGWVWGGIIAAAYGLEFWLRPGKGEGPRRGDVALVGLLSIAALAAGPYGLETALFPLKYLLRDSDSGIALMYSEVKEWAPTKVASLFGALLVGQGAAAVVGWWRMPRRSLALALVNVAFFIMALRVQRHIPVFVLVSLPPIAMGLLAPLRARLASGRAPRLRRFSLEEGRPRPIPLALWALAFMVASVGVLKSEGFGQAQLEARGYPVEAAAVMAAMPGGRVLNHYDWGGFIPWQAPEWKVFITPIPDTYPAQVFEDWLTLANQEEGWPQLMERWQVDAVLFPPEAQITASIREMAGWAVHYEDREAVLLMRTSPSPP